MDGYKLPRPCDWQKFQRMICAIYTKKYPDDIVDELGRAGQEQFGIDTYVQKRSGKVVAVQCKHKDDIEKGKLTPKLIDRELEKTRKFKGEIERYIIYTTLDADVAAQTYVLSLNAARSKNNEFIVELRFWNSFERDFTLHPEMISAFFGEFLIDKESLFAASTSSPQVGVRMSSATSPGAEGVSLLFEGKQEIIRDLERTGDYSTVRRVLERDIDGGLERYSSEERAELYYSYANVLLEFGELENAKGALQRSYDAAPETATGHAARATKCVLINDREKALLHARRALELDPRCQRAGVVILDVADPAIPNDNLLREIPSGIRESGAILSGLALRAARRAEYSTAILELRKAIAAHPHNSKFRSLLGALLLESISNLEQKTLVGGFTEEDRSALAEAKSILAEIWSTAKERPDTKLHLTVAHNLAIAHLALQERNKASKTIDEALAVDPLETGLLLLRVNVAMHAGNWAQAAETIEKLPAEQRPPGHTLRLAQAACALDDFEKAGALATALLESDVPTELRIAAAAVVIAAAQKARRDDEVVATYKRFRERFGDRVSLICAALEQLSDGNADNFNALRADLVASVAATESSLEKCMAAETLLRLNYPCEALASLTFEIDTTQHNPALWLKLRAAMAARDYQAALALYEALSDELVNSPPYSRIACNLYSAIGLLQKALPPLERLLALPHDLSLRLRWISTHYRLGNHEAIKSWFDAAPSNLSGEPGDIIEIALYAQRMFQHEKALRWAYDAFRGGTDDQLVLTRYAMLFIVGGLGKNLLKQLDVVEPNSTVIFEQSDGDTLIRTPTNIEPRLPSFHEFGVDDTFCGRRVVGAKLNDEFVWDEGGFAHKKYKITRIVPMQLWAVEWAMGQLKSSDPQHSPVVATKVVDADGKIDTSPFLKDLRRRHTQDEAIRHTYRNVEVVAPLVIIANNYGRFVYEVWEYYSLHASPFVRTKSESRQDWDAGVQSANESSMCVVDSLSVWIFSALDELGFLDRSFDAIYITQASIDQLLQYRDHYTATQPNDSGGVLSSIGNQLVFEPTNAEAFRKGLEKIDRALSYARSKPLAPAIPVRRFEPNIESWIDETCPELTAVMYAAQTLSAPVFCEDAPARTFLLSTNTKVIWSKPIQLAQRHLDQPVQIENARIALKLAARGHTGALTDLPEMYSALLITDFRVTDDTYKALQTYFGTFEIGLPQAVQLGQLAAPLLLTDEDMLRKTTLVFRMFDLVFRGRGNESLLITVAARAAREFLRAALQKTATNPLRDMINFGSSIDEVEHLRETIIRTMVGRLIDSYRIWRTTR